MNHENQHFIPKFLLRRWESGTDSRLSAFSRKHGQLREDRHKAKAVGAVPGLYSLNHAMPGHRNDLESKFFQQIDSQAALVHRALVDQSVIELHQQDRDWWARFIVSLMLRTPWELGHNIAAAPSIVASNRQRLMSEGHLPADAPDTLNAGAISDLVLMATTDTIQRTVGHVHIRDAQWMVRRFEQSKRDLLIGDAGIVRDGPLTGAFVIALPLAPRTLLLIGSELRLSRWPTMSEDELVARANRSAVASSFRNVFGTDGAHRPLVEKLLRKV